MSKSEKPPEARQNRDETTKTQPMEKEGGAAASAAAASEMKTPAKSGDGRRDWLARGLRQLYDKTLQDPIPQSFQDLLDKLEKKGRS